ncbi:MAG: DedA family protein [Calditrichae bacterium]|nr:DedA family protein [Calditrichota bacterium]MCB9059106.1 DedA family protein [Calditrichia bacterium]
MLEYIETLISHVDPFIAYLILFSSAFIENTFPPIPGDTVTVIGAYLITTGKLSFTGVWISTTLGSVLGFFTMYLFGFKFGRSFIKNKKREKIFGLDRMKKTEIWFYKYGYGIIFANRFLSGTRSVISLFAGIFKLNWMAVLGLATLSAMIWNGLLMWAGYALGVNWHKIIAVINNYNKYMIIITLLVVAGFLVNKYFFKKKLK